MQTRPHVSAAVCALRGWVTVAAAVVCAAALVQLVVFAFARYTDVRWQSPEPVVAPAAVVSSSSSGLGGGVRAMAAGNAAPSPRPAADPNRLASVADRHMGTVSNFASNAGLVAALALVLTTGMGLAVAAGASVPGVERAVRAWVWAGVVFAVALPWGWAFGAAAREGLMPGVFAGYAALTKAAEAPGSVGVVALYVVLPVLVVGVSIAVAVWFAAGVERGVIATSVSEIQEAAERELAAIRARGVATLGNGAGRASGALNQAVGETAVRTEPPLRKAAGAELLTDGVSRALLRAPGPGAEGPAKRPI